MPNFINPIGISTNGFTVNAWNTVNLSAYIPPNASGVAININSPVTGTTVGARKYGSTDNLWGYLSGPNYNLHVLCGVSTDLKADFWVNSGAGILTFYILGYFTTDEAVFFTNVVSKGTMPSSYTTYSIASDIGSDPAQGAILQTNAAYYFYARYPGSTDDYSVNSQGMVSQIVGVNGAKEFEATALLSPTLYVAGYIKRGLTWNTNQVDRTPGTAGSFSTITPPSGATSVIYMARGPDQVTVRGEPFTTYDPYAIPSNTNFTQIQAPVAVQGKISATTTKIWEQGYFTNPTIGNLGQFDPEMRILGWF